ncbi:hypothetical protein Focb16_v012800 [Fusarium oxysporum f. sp. cubense]|uniref:Uncharacterized protein n=1 Tax=Fusarium oxysporum f. sp. cubense TaxID=61366 RepID=A0A559LGD8_FUSOC|nr:hypothetical protein Focb16_v012800 [Fusarium oxysporum f. sp. cubense]
MDIGNWGDQQKTNKGIGSAHFGNVCSYLTTFLWNLWIRLGVKVLRSKNSDFVVLSVLDSLTLFYDFFLRRVRVYYPRLLLLLLCSVKPCNILLFP